MSFFHSHNKKIVTIVCVCFVFVFFISIYKNKESRIKGIQGGVYEAVATNTKEITQAEKPLWYEEHIAGLDIEIDIPKIEKGNEGSVYTQKEIETYFTRSLTEYKKNISERSEEVGKVELIPSEGRRDVYTVDTQKVFENKNIISFICGEYYNSSSQAHGRFYRHSFVYDKNKERLVKLSDIFILSPDFYTLLTHTVSKDIQEQTRKKVERVLTKEEIEQIERGLSTKEDPYSIFTVEDRGVTFYFNTYVLGPYVYGDYTSFVPFETLKTFKK